MTEDYSAKLSTVADGASELRAHIAVTAVMLAAAALGAFGGRSVTLVYTDTLRASLESCAEMPEHLRLFASMIAPELLRLLLLYAAGYFKLCVPLVCAVVSYRAFALGYALTSATKLTTAAAADIVIATLLCLLLVCAAVSAVIFRRKFCARRLTVEDILPGGDVRRYTSAFLCVAGCAVLLCALRLAARAVF